jgi:hypothetical protein
MAKLGRGSEKVRLVDLEVDRWITNTPKSWLVIIGGRRVFVPKSNCEFYEDEGYVTMPEWLAIEKELV